MVLLVAGAGAALAQGGATAEAGGGVGRLEKQVRYLAAELAACRAEADALRARLEDRLLSGGGRLDGAAVAASVAQGSARVVDVNRELGMAVVGFGSRQGARPGMELVVVRGEKPVARLLVVDVRREIAGALVGECGANAYPAPGDRLVLGAGSLER